MKSLLRIHLNATPAQVERLRALQQGFSQVCNALAPLVQRTRIWNRVALHHMAYRDLRQQFPEMGSQMVCNAIYSVSRSCRLVFQSPDSPFNLERLGSRALPLLRFHDDSPVYFDRHTLSLKNNQLSMFTLDGRMHFALTLRPQDVEALKTHKLREVVLVRSGGDAFDLVFQLESPTEGGADAPALSESSELSEPAGANDPASPIPDYVEVEEITP
jgi:hypothetical protein